MYRSFLIIFYIFLCLLLSLISCQHTGMHVGDQLKLAEKWLVSKPDSALPIIDRMLQDSGKQYVPEEIRIRLLLMRQQIFAGIQQMDSVISTGKMIRKLALLKGDSLSIARSLLPVRGEVTPEDQRDLEPWLPGAARTFADRDMQYEEAIIEGLIGGIATRKGQFAASMPHLYRARDIHEGLDSVKPLYAVYMNIGNNLSGMGDPRGAIRFYEQAGQTARRLKDSLRIATSIMNQGAVLLDMGILDSSLMYFNAGLANLPARGGEYARLQIDFNIATVLLRKGDLGKAEDAFRALVQEANVIGDPFAIGMANSGLAGVLGKTGRTGEAISIMEATLRQQDAMGMGYYSIELVQNLLALYKGSGRYVDALRASERLKLLSDSMLSADKQKAVQELVVKYDFTQQEKEKDLLRVKLDQRNLLALTLTLAVIGLAGLGMVLRQRNRYHRALNETYIRLLDSYRAKRDSSDAELPPPVVRRPDVQPDPDEDIEGTSGHSGETETTATEEELELHNRILRYFNTEKPYLDPDLKVEDLARHFDVPARRIAETLRAVTGQGCPDYVNRFRVAEATRLMDATEQGALKLEFIAGKSGFRSRQHFRRVFEQVTGVNPSFYRTKKKL